MARGACKVVSVNGALTVTFTTAAGGTPTVYSDEALTAAVALPATVADGASTTFYFSAPGAYVLSVKTSGGTQIAGDANQTRIITISTGQTATLAYDARLLAVISGDTGRSTAASSGTLPLGGTTSQVLKKNSNTDFDVAWAATATASNATPLIAGTASPGTGTAFTRDDHVHPPFGQRFASGFSYCIPGPSSTFAPTNNKMSVAPLVVSNAITISTFRMRVTVGQAGSNVRFVLYADNGSGLPGSLIYGGPQVATTGAGTVTDTPGSTLTITPGIYWLGTVAQASGTVATMTYINGAGQYFIAKTAAGMDVINPGYGSVSVDGVSGAPPGTFGTPNLVGASDPALRVFFDVA